MIALDHLVLAAATLEEGARLVRERLGASPSPGGAHPGFGTHNALLSLGPGCYLEVLAPDPAQPSPAHPRLFGLDAGEVRSRLARGPFLLHWVARSDALEADLARLAVAAGLAPGALGAPVAMSRGELRWRLTLRADGRAPPAGLPSLIDWGATPHPTRRLPDAGLRLRALELPAAAAALTGTVAPDAPLHGGADALRARLSTSLGERTIE